MYTDKASAATRIKLWWRRLSASQQACHSSADLKRFRVAGWVIAIGILVGTVGGVRDFV